MLGHARAYLRRILTPLSGEKRLLGVPASDSRHLDPIRAALLGVALAGSCAVYDVPTTRGNADGVAGGNGFGGSGSGDGSAASPAEAGSSVGQPPSIAGDAGQAGANDSDEAGAGNGGAAGASAGGWAGAASSGTANSGAGESLGGNGGAAGDAGSSGGSASAAGSPSCVTGWRNQSACDQCATQTQPDLQACAMILDCYVRQRCGPHSCATTDQVCGPNVLRKGAAAYSIAQDVYACICK